MKKLSIIGLGLLGFTLVTSSCNKFLDTLPDNRTEVNTPDKVKSLLVSAYPTLHRAGIIEHRTDNVQDNGTLYDDNNTTLRANYYWQWHQDTDWDTAQGLWETCYSSISAANQALQSIEEMGSGPELQASKGEALMCRAWGHFLLVTTFSHAYNSETSATDKGMPYFVKPENSVHIKAERMSVKETYERIEQDIKEAYPLIDDANYSNATKKYHFNKRAAAAFMAEFYLAFERWEEAKKYADIALGDNVASQLNKVAELKKLPNSKEYTYAYINADNPANLMLQATRSLWARWYHDRRYGHADAISRSQTVQSQVPGNTTLVDFDRVYYYGSPEPLVFQPKMEEIFEITNVLAQTGQPHVVAFPFTVDKALLARAEAEVLLGQYEAAAADLSMWYESKGGKKVTRTEIENFYTVPTLNPNSSDQEKEKATKMLATICKPLQPRFATPLAPGTQYHMVQAVLHAKRILTVHEGNRWDDIKRYGIEITHEMADGSKDTLQAHDARKAIQIPANIITAGLEPNTY